MRSLFKDFDFLHAHLDVSLIISCNTYEVQLDTLGKVLQRLKEKGLHIDVPQSTSVTDKIDYLEYTLPNLSIK